MNIYTNEAYFNDQLQRAKRVRTYGVLAVVGSFVMSLLAGYNALLIVLAYPLLIAGFPMWTYGRSKLRRLTQSPRPDKLIDAELKGLSNKLAIHHYPSLDGRIVKHLLVMPGGLLVMESSDALGPISCTNQKGADRWHNRVGWLDRMSGLNQPVGNPSADLIVSMSSVKGLLEGLGKPQVPVMGLAVFTRNPEIEVEGCRFEGLPLDELKETVRSIQYELGGERPETGDVARLLTSEDRRRLNALLAPNAPQAPGKPASVKRREAEKV